VCRRIGAVEGGLERVAAGVEAAPPLWCDRVRGRGKLGGGRGGPMREGCGRRQGLGQDVGHYIPCKRDWNHEMDDRRSE
jgi:hypothetical protein